jgi:hypothetical protein
MKLLILLLLLGNQRDTTHKSYHWYPEKQELFVYLREADTSVMLEPFSFIDRGKLVELYKFDTLIVHIKERPAACYHLYSRQWKGEPIIDTSIVLKDNNYHNKGDTVLFHHYQYGDFTDDQVREYAKKPTIVERERVL